jgi:carbonic anhydrase/acetyltransferase-like protein (isoleucine patch superfamily)
VIIEGQVEIGEGTYIAPGTIISAIGGSISIGSKTVIMENAIIRSSPKFDCKIGDHVLVGPKACITGATIENACFIATNATIFHGSHLQGGTVLAVNGIIHVGTHCPANTYIPINHIAYGNPAVIYSPTQILDFHAELRKIGFVKYVYDIETSGLSNTAIYEQLTEKFLSFV